MQRSLVRQAVPVLRAVPLDVVGSNGHVDGHVEIGDRDETARMSRRLGGLGPFVAEVLSYDATWVLDVCCGAADLTREVVEEARARGRRMEFVALDESDAILAIARERTGNDPLVRFVRADARLLPFPDDAFDLSTCTLSLHRFEPADVIDVLREMRRVTRLTPMVCDLERSRLGVLAASAVARFEGKRRPTGYDASLSVKRSYTMSELEEFASLAGWRAPSARRSGLFHIVMSDGE